MTKDQLSIRRILVALDASPASLSAMQNAVELAARLGAELIGLFVEDINLLRAGGHLIRARNGRLAVFVVAEDEAGARELQLQAEQRLQDQGLGADFRLLVRPGLNGLARMIAMESRGPVVLPCEKEPLEGEQLCALVDQLANPVMLVR